MSLRGTIPLSGIELTAPNLAQPPGEFTLINIRKRILER
jgi:hypothetical protein